MNLSVIMGTELHRTKHPDEGNIKPPLPQLNVKDVGP